jgi:hypothetical protein
MARPQQKENGQRGSSASAEELNNQDQGEQQASADQGTSQAPCLAAALAYAGMGWEVFLAPATGAKKGIKAAEYSGGAPWGKTTDAEQIKRDFGRWKNANIGIACGPVSGFFVVEVDTPEGHDKDGFASLRDLEAAHGVLPATRRAISPSGSMHYYFKWPASGKVINSTSKVGPGIDVRGEGGMVIAPPSVRPGKGVYLWRDELPIADAPAWLLEQVADDPAERKASKPQAALERVARALAVIPNHDLPWEPWNHVGMATFAATGGRGFEAFDTWSRKSSKYDEATTAQRWKDYNGSPPTEVGAGTLFFMASEIDPNWDASISLADFRAYMPMHNYIFVPTGEPWLIASINARFAPLPVLDAKGEPKFDEKGKPITIKASTWLDRNQPVEQMTWAPGLPMLIRNRLIADGGWIERAGVTLLNLYKPPTTKHGDAREAGRWVELVGRVFGEQASHIIRYLAQRVQQPGIKPNHALVLGGDQGIGKDTILEPVKYGVGHWNFQEVSPSDLLSDFNPFAKSIILRISEARDLGDINRYQFYEKTKTYAAAPPDVLPCTDKHLRRHYVQNCCGTIITTNYKSTGLYLPANDRRHYVAWSDLKLEDFTTDYWNAMWSWYYTAGGLGHVVAYLDQLDISEYDPKAPPEKTAAFWEIVDANRAPEDSELEDTIDALGAPPAVTIDDLILKASSHGLSEWLRDRKNRRIIPGRMEHCGYVPVRNADRKTGMWVVAGRRCGIYARADLAVRDRLAAATKRASEG